LNIGHGTKVLRKGENGRMGDGDTSVMPTAHWCSHIHLYAGINAGATTSVMLHRDKCRRYNIGHADGIRVHIRRVKEKG